MTGAGYDCQCPQELNGQLNKLDDNDEIHYTVNEQSCTTRKVDPYTAVQTNDITNNQLFLKSSVCLSINCNIVSIDFLF